MAKTKNTARSNPFELPRTTVTDHIRAIAATTDREFMEAKEMGSSTPLKLRSPKLKMLN